MPQKSKTIFLTGATGLIGSYLLKLLLEDGCVVHALARPEKDRLAAERVLERVRFWDSECPVDLNKNLFVWEGDITVVDCGLGDNIDVLINTVDEIIHCAAAIEFYLDWEQIHSVNVLGTQHVLDLAMRCRTEGKLTKCNHLSTAFICGSYTDTFSEDEFDVSQGFNSNYEKSKFQAEQIVRAYRDKGLWIDIFRPAFVVGESTSGKTFRFQHLYQILQLWSRELFDLFPIEENRPINMVTVDLVAKAIQAISQNTTVPNSTYHLFPQHPVSLDRFLTIASKLIGFKRPQLCAWSQFDASGLTPAQKILIDMNSLYFVSDPRLNSDRTIEMVRKMNFACNDIDDSVIKNMIQYVLASNFIKPKLPKI